MAKRATWLSIVPEPERELPAAVATLTAGRQADDAAIAAERARIERIVLRRGQRRWLRYLHDVVELIERRTQSVDPEVTRAADRARRVIANHHNLLLGLPGASARLTAGDRARLEEWIDDRCRRPRPGVRRDRAHAARAGGRAGRWPPDR